MKDLIEALNRAHELDEAAVSGGVAGDNSASGGTVRGRGASVQPSKTNYLNRMKSKNPDLVDTMVIKVSDIKPGMITQAGQVKEAEARNHPSGGKKMYIMHTNGYDGFWGLDETMDVMVDPENKSKPFAGDYRALLKRGLQESVVYNPDDYIGKKVTVHANSFGLGDYEIEQMKPYIGNTYTISGVEKGFSDDTCFDNTYWYLSGIEDAGPFGGYVLDLENNKLDEDKEMSVAVKNGVTRALSTARAEIQPCMNHLEGALVEYFDKYKNELEPSEAAEVKIQLDNFLSYINVSIIDTVSKFKNQLK